MYFATKRRQTQILVWLIWAVACLVFWAWPEQAVVGDWSVPDLPALPGIVTHDPGNGPLFPWHPRHRCANGPGDGTMPCVERIVVLCGPSARLGLP